MPHSNYNTKTQIILLIHCPPLLYTTLILLYEPRHEKPAFLHICENKGADQLLGNRPAHQYLCFRYVYFKSLYSQNLKVQAVAEQPGLCPTWSETEQTCFLSKGLISLHPIQRAVSYWVSPMPFVSDLLKTPVLKSSALEFIR